MSDSTKPGDTNKHKILISALKKLAVSSRQLFCYLEYTLERLLRGPVLRDHIAPSWLLLP